MIYEEILQHLYALTRFGTKLNLDNIACLLEKLGNPEKKFRTVHVTGSKGKGSVCAFLHSVLKAAGFKTGLYTSPHLIEFNERIVVNGEKIPKEKVVEYYNMIRDIVGGMVAQDRTKQVTFFEFTTAMAFKYFADLKVDYAVVEVGLGGRLDATNVIFPDCCIITNVELEHTNVLGKTIEKIAREKAGIIKPGVPVVTAATGRALKVIEEVARLNNSEVLLLKKEMIEIKENRKFSVRYGDWSLEDLEISLSGNFQFENAALAVLCAKVLGIDERSIREGLETAVWRGRFEKVHQNPDVIVDCAHTPRSAEALVESLAANYDRVNFVFGVFKDKRKGKILRTLSRIGSEIIITEPDSPRAEKAERVKRIAEKYFRKVEVMQREQAFAAILSRQGVWCICGSVYLAGDALAFFEKQKSERVPENTGIDWYKLVETLEKTYGDAGHYDDPFRVLVATILSQRTKDEVTYPRAEALFARYPDALSIARAKPEEIAEIIRPVGFYNIKARKIIEVARIVVNTYNGKVPDSMDALLKLPGVGRKTANCVLVFGFGKDALPVDTHVHRISNRMGVINTENPEETENALKRVVPKPLWKKINYLFVEHGKNVCKPVKPGCERCQIAGFCGRRV
ncbi:MAG: Mur ligase family protein [Thermoplasmata archaeon]|nr:Mur ligase family protein [Thermoplasmata archaeon]